jgi:hypothetical protein
MHWLAKTLIFWALRREVAGHERQNRIPPERLSKSNPLPPLAAAARRGANQELAAQINEARTRVNSPRRSLALARQCCIRRDLNPTGRLGDVFSMPPRNGWSVRCDNADDGTRFLR